MTSDLSMTENRCQSKNSRQLAPQCNAIIVGLSPALQASEWEVAVQESCSLLLLIVN